VDIEYPQGTTRLDPDEIEGLKFKHVMTREQLDHLEQANIEQGLIWLRRCRNKDILNEGFVKELHKRLFGEVWVWAGTFRRTEKNIGIDPLQIAVELRNLLDDARFWTENNTYSPPEAAIRFHHRLVYIHLFPNGNGRHARIMADIMLTEIFNCEPADWARGYNFQAMGDRRKLYIQALREADKGDFKMLLQFVSKHST